MTAIPEYMRPVVIEEPPASPQLVAEHAVLALNDTMLRHYDASLAIFTRNLLDQRPVILAMFTGQGGQMTLYRPGQEPEHAPPVPLLYQLAKSIGHSSMAVYQIVAPYLSNAAANQLWRAPLETYRTENRLALEGIDDLGIDDDARSILRSILELNLAFMDACLAQASFTPDDVQDFVRSTVPHSFRAIGLASGLQVGHWMEVLDRWQEALGPEWDTVYAASNSLYVARQNNILFSVLVQYLGEEAIGDRLLLIETPDFETSPEKLLEVLARIVADRSLGAMFFRDYFLMDAELLGGGARAAIEREMARRGRTPVLPPLAPFRSTEWPWKTDPARGTGPARLQDAAFDTPVEY